MSTTIDSRVVSMQFDNKHFEQNVATSMSTLDKLKQKLNFSGATKGLDELNTATKNVNMSGLGNAVEGVSAKFSALQVMGVTALANITNSAVNAGKRMVSALTIDPVKTGFSEYETQINAIQTILANTQSKGTTLDDVNSALDELNKYADKTIYNFTEMTRNIGTFTAAGIDLDTSVNAIQGIANLAAVSGSTSQQASTAMYQLSQALASGTVKLMDWNSVVNAGMGGQVFQDALKETARLHGVAIDQMIEDEGSFRETLKNGWLSSEILTDTLEKFTMCAEEGSKEWNEYMETLKSKGYTEEQAREILKLGKTATEAATKVKTFSQLWDTLKEAAQSGWTQTWELIVGDFEEAKSLLTGISDFMNGVIGKMSDWRNNILAGALGSPFKNLQESLEKILSPAKKVTESLEGTKKMLESIEQMAQRVIRGDFGNGAERLAIFTENGWDYAAVQNKVNEMLGVSKRHAQENAKNLSDCAEAQENVADAQKYTLKSLMELNEEQLKNLGLNDEEIKSLKMLAEYSEKTGIPIEELAKDLDQLNGRTLLINSFKNMFSALGKVFTTIKEAWQDIFPPKSVEERAAGLYNMIAALHKFSLSLTVSEETAEKFRKTFAGLFALIDIILTLTAGPLKIAFTILTEILAMFDLNILDVTAAIGDAIVKFRDWIKENNFLVKGLQLLKPYIVGFAQGLKEWFNNINFTRIFADIIANVKAAKDAFVEWFNGLKESENIPQYILQGIVSLAKSAGGLLKAAFAALGNAIKNLLIQIPGVGEWLTSFEEGGSILTRFVDKLKSVRDSIVKWFTNLPGVDKWLSAFSSIGEWFKGIKDAENIPKYIIQGLVNGLKSGAKLVFETVSGIAKGIIDYICDILGIHSPSTVMIAIGGFLIAGLLIGLKDKLGGLWDVLSTIGAKFVDWIKEVNFGTVIAAVITGGMVIAGLKIANALKNLTSPLEGLSDMFGEIGDAAKRMSKGVKNYFNSKAVLNMAIAIAVLAASVALLTLIDQSKMWQAVGAIGALVVALGLIAGIAALMNKLGGAGDTKGYISMVVNTIAVAAAIALLAVTLKQIAEVNLEGIWPKLGVLAAVVGGMVAIAALFGILGKFGLTAGIPMAVIGLIGISVAINIMVGVIKNAGALQASEIERATGAIKLVGELFFSFIAVSWLAGFASGKAGSMLLKASVAMLIMIGVIKVAAMLQEDEVKKATETIMFVGELFIGMIAVSALAGLAAGKAGSMLLKASLAMLVMVGVIKIAAGIDGKTVEKATDVIMRVGGMFAALIAVSLIAGVNAKKAGSLLLQASTALLIIVGVIALIGLIPQESIDKALPVVMGIMACFAALILCLGVLRGQDVGKIKGTLIVLTVIVALVAGVLVALSFIPAEDLIPAAIALGSVLTAVLLALAVVMRQSKYIKKSTGAILALSLIFVALGAALAVLSQMPTDGVLAAAGSLAGVMIALAVVLAIIKKMNLTKTGAQKLERGIRAMGGLVLALVAVAAALAIAGKVTHSGERALVMTAMLYALWPLLQLLRRMNLTKTEGQKLERGIRALIGVAGSMAAFAGALMLIGNVKHVGEKALVMTAMMYAMWGLLKLIQTMNITKAEGQKLERGILALLGLAAALAALVGVLILMGLVEHALNKAVVLTAFAYAMTLLLYALKPIGKMVRDALFSVLTLGSLAVALSALVGVLMLMGLVEHAVERAVILTLFAAAMTGLLYVLKPIGQHIQQALLGVVALLAMAVPLLAFVGVLAAAQYVDVALGTVAALVALVVVCGLLLVPLTLVGTMFTSALLGVVALLAMAVPLLAFVGVLAVAQNVDVALGTVVALIALMTTCSLLLIPLTLIGTLVASALLGVTALLAMAVPMVAFVGILYLMEGLNDAEKNVDILIRLMTAMEVMLGVVAILGPMAIVGEAALVGLVALITGVGALAIAIGALFEHFPALKEFMNSGIALLEDLAYSIGSMIGNMLAGFGDAVSASLPAIGTALTDFMNNAKGFIDGCKAIDDKVLSGAANLAGAILAIVGASFFKDIVNLLPGIGDLQDMGSDLSGFMANASGFINGAKMIDSKLVSGIESLAGVIMTLTAANLIDGITSFITGGASLASFGSQLTPLGEGVAGFVTKLKDGGFTTDDVEICNAAANVIAKLAGIDIPNEGGFISWIVGDNTLDGFAAKLAPAAEGIVDFVSALRSDSFTLTADDMTIAENAANLISKMASISIPNEGGFLSWIVGDNTLDGFADKLAPTASGIVAFVKTLKSDKFTLTESDVSLAKNAASLISSLASVTVPTDGGFINWIKGQQSLDDFASKLPKVATAVVDFCNTLNNKEFTLGQGQMSIATNAATMVSSLAGIKVPDDGGFFGWVTGKQGLDDFASKLPKVATGVKNFVTGLSGVTSTQAKTAVDCVTALNGLADVNVTTINSVATNLNNMATNIGSKLGQAVSTIFNAMDQAVQGRYSIEAYDLGKSLLDEFGNGLANKTSKTAAITNASAIVDSASEAMGGAYEYHIQYIESLGKACVQGFANGMKNNKSIAEAAARSVAEAAAAAAEAALDINSPSKVFMAIGHSVDEGLAMGITKYTGEVDDSIYGVAGSAANGMSNAIAGIADAINSDIDSQPMIRPVLDLSDVESKAGRIGGLLNGQSLSASIRSAGGISSMMNLNSQNGVNDDVVAALKDLRGELGNARGDTYQINGVTYDDGSNIRAFAEAVVRQSRVGRRV